MAKVNKKLTAAQKRARKEAKAERQKMQIQYGCTGMQCGNVFKQKKMKTFLEFEKVSVTVNGDYYQIVFHMGKSSVEMLKSGSIRTAQIFRNWYRF